MNMKIVERVRYLLSSANVPNHYWGDDFSISVYHFNISPSYPLQRDVPNKVYYGKKVSYDHLEVFGVRPLFISLKMKGQSLIQR
jgi:hypothetical protein